MATLDDPLPTDRTQSTLMGPLNHPNDHNTIADRLNEVYLWMLNVIEAGGIGGGGTITAEDIEEAVTAGILTPAAIGAPDIADVLLLESGRLRLPLIASDASPPPSGFVDFYGYTGGEARVQVPGGKKTVLGPPHQSLYAELATTADISTETLQDILTVNVEANARYKVQVDIPYECAFHTGTLGGQLRNAFAVPGGSGVGASNSKGSWRSNALIVTAGSTSGGTGSNSFIRRLWDASLDMGGRGSGNPLGASIEGTLVTGTTAGTFKWRARRAATDATVARIYGLNEPTGLGPASMTLWRVA
jgi:hypothetical protein